MPLTFTESITLETITCGNCAGAFALNQNWLDAKRRESGWFTCPYCSVKRGWGKTEADRLREQLAVKSSELSAAKCETARERNLREQEERRRAEAERKLNRVGAGVCPCCNRTFTNLARHMKTKHPRNPDSRP